MEKQSKIFFPDSQIQWKDLGGGILRKILGYDDKIMMVKLLFKKGAVGNMHHHFHSQATFCVSGSFEFTINTEKHVVQEGDSLYMPPDVEHGVVCHEEGILIDVFSPAREDFLDGSKLAYLGKEE